jgi:hypothetical protein
VVEVKEIAQAGKRKRKSRSSNDPAKQLNNNPPSNDGKPRGFWNDHTAELSKSLWMPNAERVMPIPIEEWPGKIKTLQTASWFTTQFYKFQSEVIATTLITYIILYGSVLLFISFK